MINASYIVGDVRYSSIENEDKNPLRSAETFLFELSELMQQYNVVKIDVSFDAFKYAQTTNCKSV